MERFSLMRKLLAVAAVLAVQIGAQTPAAKNEAGTADGAPVFRSTTHLVQVNVIVRHKGDAVTDLKKEDFRLFDNGKQQTISTFSVESSNGKLPTSPVRLPPGVYTNKLLQKPGTPQSVTVILLDTQHSKLEDQMFARQQVVKFLQTIRPEDRVALYLLNGRGLKVLHDYTTDSTDLLRALNAFSDGKTLPDLSQGQNMSFGTDMISLNSWMMTGTTGQERDMYMVQAVKGTLKVIEFIANHLSSLPGRKNLIWVSSGFPLTMGFNDIEEFNDPSREHRTFTEEITECVKAVNSANVAIYPVDSRGLVADQRFSAQNQKVDLTPKLSMGPIVENQQTMEELASRTGGKAFYNTNDLKHAIRDAIADASTTYTLGFYPADEKYDGKFHKFSVKVEHAGFGYDVRYRKGYFDFASRPTDERQRKSEVNNALLSPLDSSALGVSLGAVRVDQPVPNSMKLRVMVDTRGIGFHSEGELMKGMMHVYIAQKNDRGNQFNATDNKIELTYTKPQFAQKMKDGGIILPDTSVALVSQATQLRVVVRDEESGTLGSVTVPLRGGPGSPPKQPGLIRRDGAVTPGAAPGTAPGAAPGAARAPAPAGAPAPANPAPAVKPQ
jgi:VWFA-related protein